MPTFPLPTLAPTVDASGISAPSFNDIFQSMIATFQSIYGSDVLLTPDTQDLQWIAALAQARSDENQAIIAVYNGFLPTFALGAALSALVKINGLSRNVATSSTATVTVVGVTGTVINNGIAQDENGNLWNLPSVVTIPLAGTIDVGVLAQSKGAIVAPANSINQIFTPTSGWQSVNNAADAVIGAPIESDAALRARQVISTSLPAQTPLQAIIAAVANVTGVTRFAIYENDTNATDANGVPSHSISVVVLGGDPVAIAQTIEQKKSPGTGTFGTTSEIVLDPAGLPITIKFFVLTTINVYVTVNVKAQTGFVSATIDAIKASILEFITSLPIGDTVRFSWVLSAASLVGTTEELTFYISSLFMGITPGPVGTADIPILFNQAATTITANLIVNVT